MTKRITYVRQDGGVGTTHAGAPDTCRANFTVEAEGVTLAELRGLIERAADYADAVAVPRDLLEQVSQELEQTWEDLGRCDHSVGVCTCSLAQLVEDVRTLLGKPPKWPGPEMPPDPYDREPDEDRLLEHRFGGGGL